MTQRQLDLMRPTYEPNIIPLGINHIVEIRKKGKAVGIYKLSAVSRKKRGLSLPLHIWRSLQNQLPIINLNLQFANGTVGVDILEDLLQPQPVTYKDCDSYMSENVLQAYENVFFQTLPFNEET